MVTLGIGDKFAYRSPAIGVVEKIVPRHQTGSIWNCVGEAPREEDQHGPLPHLTCVQRRVWEEIGMECDELLEFDIGRIN